MTGSAQIGRVRLIVWKWPIWTILRSTRYHAGTVDQTAIVKSEYAATAASTQAFPRATLHLGS
jgi:hypothetical protein